MKPNFQTRTVSLDYQAALVEQQTVELGKDLPQAHDCSLFAAISSSEQLLRSMNHVREIVGQISREPVKVVGSPCIVNVIECVSGPTNHVLLLNPVKRVTPLEWQALGWWHGRVRRVCNERLRGDPPHAASVICL